MSNVAGAFKSEMSRLAKKELRIEVAPLKKAQASLRDEVAMLKRSTRTLEQAIQTLARHVQKVSPRAESTPETTKTRFSAKSLSSQRRRLGLSAEELGRLIGASGQSVYNWEAGKARPRPSHLVSIAALRTLGKKSAAAKLLALVDKEAERSSTTPL